SVFPKTGIIISFSSGIIILFCYYAILTRYERKNYRNKIIITLTITCFTIIAIREKEGLTNIITANIINISPFLVIAIAVIILSMVCINKTMFIPTKSLINSYLDWFGVVPPFNKYHLIIQWLRGGPTIQ